MVGLDRRKTRSRALVAALAALVAVLVVGPASANAATVLGSGSSANVPYLEALFKGYKKVDPKVKFVFTANNGNAGAKDVQDGKSQFAIQTRPPLPSDSGLSYSKLFLDGLCVAVNPATTACRAAGQPGQGHLPGHVDGVVGLRLEPEQRRSRRSGATRPPASTRSSRARCSAGRRRPRTSRRWTRTARSRSRSPRTTPASATSAWPTRKPANGVKRAEAQRPAVRREAIKTLKYPLSRYAWLVLPAAKKPNKNATEVRRLGPDELRGRQDHREGRRGARVQREASRRRSARRRSSRRAVEPEGYTRRPRGLLPDQRAELMLGALVCCVLLFVALLIVFVFREAWPSFAHNGLCLVRRRRQPRPAGPGDLHVGEPEAGARLHVPRLADHLGHDPGHRRRGDAQLRLRAVRRGLRRRVRARVDAPHPRAGRAPARERALGDLRPARRARARAVHRRARHHRREPHARSPTSSR